MELLRQWRILLALLTVWAVDSKPDEAPSVPKEPGITTSRTEVTLKELSPLTNKTSKLRSADNDTTDSAENYDWLSRLIGENNITNPISNNTHISGRVTPKENPGSFPSNDSFGLVPTQQETEWTTSEQTAGTTPVKGGFGWDINTTLNPFPEDGWGYPYEEDETIELSLQQGIILGKRERTGIAGRYFYSFRGIPFAEPPVGSLRFKDPVPASPWNGTIDGTIDPPKCPQLQFYITVGEEDCLFLNVYTPKLNSSDLPVMVWVHGGSFVVGGADEYPPLPIMTKDVVLVTIQYRLGTLGFLSTEDSVMPGNLGLKDQTQALHWVKDNIRYFGGNPNNVTIFGQSAGAASVHLQVISPRARGLFKRAIMQSGSALSQWAIRTDHREIAINVGKKFNCSSGEGQSFNSSSLLECLQALPLNDVVGIPSLFTMIVSRPTVMTPRVDGTFLPDHPAAMLKQGIYNKVDVMTGVNKHDGAIIAIPFLQNPWLVNELMINFEVAAPALMCLEKESSSVQLASQILDFYLRGFPISMEVADAFVQLMSDLDYKFDHDEVTKIHAGDFDLGLKTYSYEFQYRGQYSLTDLYGPEAGMHWVTLADDLPYLFNSRLTILRRQDDLIIRNLMVDLWTNFAKTGNPTPDYSLAFQWLPVTPNCLRYLAIDRISHMKLYDRTMVMEFWRRLPLQTNSYLNPPHKWQSFFHEAPGPVQECWA